MYSVMFVGKTTISTLCGKKFGYEVLEMNPNFAEAYKDLGALEFRRKNYHEAIKHFETAIRLDGSIVLANKHIGDAFRELGRAPITHPSSNQ